MTKQKCQWPNLTQPYKQALQKAVDFIFNNFKPLGIIVSGSIIRNVSHQNSDLDINVLHADLKRQRIQKFFNRVPTEIFVNPVKSIESYFTNEQARGRPCTAHMWATGFVIFNNSPEINRLQQQAQQLLQQPPNPTPAKLTQLCYAAADRYENALDIATINPTSCNLLLSLAVYDMLHYYFWQSNRYLPRDKDLLDKLTILYPPLATVAHQFYQTAVLKQRLMLAAQIADLTIGVHGFFEWESPLEIIKDK